MKLTAVLLAIVLLNSTVASAAGDPASWKNLEQLQPGQPLRVNRVNNPSIKGALISVSADSLRLRTDHNELAIPRAEVVRVQRQSGSGHKAIWLGLAIGAGAGAGIGAGVAQGVSGTSGGDFANLKPAITGALTAVGALVGLAIGFTVDNRHSTVYKAK